MFAKNSRYAKLPDVVTLDAAGHAVESKALRLLPATAGDFQHTVEENDRLDQLAYRYYKQPQKWWRICDGNPDILSPQALVGQTALVTQRIPLLLADAPPPWSLLVANVEALLGVGDAQVKEEFTLVTEQQLSGDTLIAVTTEVRRAHLLVTYLRPLTTTEELVQAITLAGFVAGAPETLSRIGKAITIPPDTLK